MLVRIFEVSEIKSEFVQKVTVAEATAPNF